MNLNTLNKMTRIFITLFSLLISVSIARSATITAISDGDWTDTSIWSLGRVPQSGDEIIIPASRNVDIPLFEGVDLTGPEVTTLRVLGTLDFALSDLTIDSGDGDSVIVGPNGTITPNGAIYFDARFNDPVFVTVFTGGAINGPVTIANGVLPIELISFEANVEETAVVLHWSTASEINNDYFTILRSEDGIDYIEIDTLAGAGNSSKILHYSYTDKNPLAGRSYYRIQQTDFNGDFELFDPISIDIDFTEEHSLSFTNPALRGGSISVSLQNVDKINSISIVNINGQIEYTAVPNNDRINIDINSDTKPGLYLIRVDGENYSESARLLIQ